MKPVICSHAEGCTRSDGRCLHLAQHEYGWGCDEDPAFCCWDSKHPIPVRCVPKETP